MLSNFLERFHFYFSSNFKKIGLLCRRFKCIIQSPRKSTFLSSLYIFVQVNASINRSKSTSIFHSTPVQINRIVVHFHLFVEKIFDSPPPQVFLLKLSPLTTSTAKVFFSHSTLTPLSSSQLRLKFLKSHLTATANTYTTYHLFKTPIKCIHSH